MAVTKEEVGRTPMVERAANLSADPCWREKAVNSVNSVNTMRGVLKERGSMVVICEIVLFELDFIFIVCVCVCEREIFISFGSSCVFFFFFLFKKKTKLWEKREENEFYFIGFTGKQMTFIKFYCF